MLLKYDQVLCPNIWQLDAIGGSRVIIGFQIRTGSTVAAGTVVKAVTDSDAAVNPAIEVSDRI